MDLTCASTHGGCILYQHCTPMADVLPMYMCLAASTLYSCHPDLIAYIEGPQHLQGCFPCHVHRGFTGKSPPPVC
jgi:hypothetical protein